MTQQPRAGEFAIPVVSLADFHAGGEARRDFVAKVGSALVEVGFLALADHGVNLSLIEGAYALAERFFQLPGSAKAAYEIAGLKGQRGFTSFGREHAKDSPAPDLKEFWHVGQEQSPRDVAYPDNVWPAEVPEFREVFTAVFRQVEGAAMGVLRAAALHLGEPELLFAAAAHGGNSILRMIHYPPIPADAPVGAVRAAAHEDINLITLLCEATAGGLELLGRDGVWYPVHALKGHIIVDSGDMLQNWTNGYYRSTTHRVVNPTEARERRFSMPMFIHPRSSVDLTPLASSIALTGGVVKFPSQTAGEYLGRRLAEIGLA